jgi:hypothetical protein
MGETVKKPHRVVARLNRWGDVVLDIECPYTLADWKLRRCNLGTEPDHCDFIDYENGEHHWNCATRKDRNAPCSGGDGEGPEGSPACWREPGRPDECDGFYGEAGHLHPTEGCWAKELIGEIGWDDAVSWMKDQAPPTDVDLPLLVDVESDDEGIYLTLWAEAS